LQPSGWYVAVSPQITQFPFLLVATLLPLEAAGGWPPAGKLSAMPWAEIHVRVCMPGNEVQKIVWLAGIGYFELTTGRQFWRQLATRRQKSQSPAWIHSPDIVDLPNE
jgi:hypothetical protein